jgi:hypothetical protein
MNDRDRLQHLRGVLTRLERMPASADRDWMLREVRSRAVDVESGARPAAIRALPLDEANAEIAAAEAAHAKAIIMPACEKPARVKTPRRATSRPAARATRATRVVTISPQSLPALREWAGSDRGVDLLEAGGRLCLDDAPAGSAARPWEWGLRG